MKKISIYLVAFLLSMSVYAQSLSDVQRQIETGQVYTAKKNLLQMIGKNPNDAKLLLLMGEWYFMQSKLDSAAMFYDKAIAAAPEDAYCLVGSGKIAFQKGDTLKAKELFEKARKTKKKDIPVYAAIANAYTSGEKKNIPNALAYLNMAKEINYKSSELNIAYGDAYLALGDYGKGANAYQLAIQFDKNNMKPRYNIAKLYMAAKNYEESKKFATEIIELDSTYLIAHKLIGELSYNRAKYNDACWFYKKYIDRAEFNPEDIRDYAFALYFNKNFPESQKYIKQIQAINPNDPVLLRLQGYIGYESQDFKSGLESMQKFFTFQPADKVLPSDYEYYGKLLIKNNIDSLGAQNLQTAIEKDSSKTNLWEDVAKSYSKSKKYIKAAYAYEQLIATKDTGSASDYYGLGQAYQNECDILMADSIRKVKDSTLVKTYLNKAIEAYGMVVKRKPDTYLGYYARAGVYARLDPETESGIAKPYYEETINVIEKTGTVDKNKKILITSYTYLGYYYYVKGTKLPKSDQAGIKKAKEDGTVWLQKVIALDPNNKQANDILKLLK